MSDIIALENKRLIGIRTGRTHDAVHPAWKDKTNDEFLICFAVELVFDDEPTLTILPCEVEISGRYPGLGLEVSEGKIQEHSFPYETDDLHSKILNIRQADYLGEGVENQMEFTFENGNVLVIRHVFPPMTLGIKIEICEA